MRKTAIQQEKNLYEESNNIDSPCKHRVFIKTYKLNIKQMININKIKVICVLIMRFQKNLQNLNKKKPNIIV